MTDTGYAIARARARPARRVTIAVVHHRKLKAQFVSDDTIYRGWDKTEHPVSPGSRVLAGRLLVRSYVCCRSRTYKRALHRPRYDRPKCHEIYDLRLACTKRYPLTCTRRYPPLRRRRSLSLVFLFYTSLVVLLAERVLLSNASLARCHANARLDQERSAPRSGR